MSLTFHRLRIKEVRRETEDCVSLQFEVPEELKEAYAYQAGQYLTLKKELDGEELRRSYSLCSAPHENEWRVAVKEVENGRFSGYANNSLKAGDELDVMTPAGNFYVSPEATRKKSYVLFAAGSGITPIISIAKTILKEEPGSTVSLFFGNKNFHSVIFREELEDLKNEHLDRFRLVHVFSRENPGNEIQQGRINQEKCGELQQAFLKYEKENLEEAVVYICGPEAMILDVKESMLKFGLKENQVHIELFGTSETKKEVVVQEGPVIEANVRIILDGDAYDLSLQSDSQSILDAAQDVGADLPFACKGGVCCTCKARIMEGTARMDVNYALEADEVENGYILTCQAHPTSEKLVVSFDE
ncbi:MAG: phenylacetate-CoA oxygenase/reductase subunit PaaK [Bacteroidetes bacterium]|nr:MAG: phenylacetate-CoA oxygenase/reductase subunit PaaK [Bacteroidota bacterium]